MISILKGKLSNDELTDMRADFLHLINTYCIKCYNTHGDQTPCAQTATPCPASRVVSDYIRAVEYLDRLIEE